MLNGPMRSSDSGIWEEERRGQRHHADLGSRKQDDSHEGGGYEGDHDIRLALRRPEDGEHQESDRPQCPQKGREGAPFLREWSGT